MGLHRDARQRFGASTSLGRFGPLRPFLRKGSASGAENGVQRAMSGRRQHYLPRFLLRSFRYAGDGDRALVYAHERSRVYPTNVMGLGQERDFYGHPEHSGLDAAISATETKLAATFHRLLRSTEGEVDPAEAATLVSALSIRTKCMRQAMIELAPVMISALGEHLDNEGVMREAFRKESADPKLFDETMAAELSKLPPLNRNTRVAFEQFARHAWNRLRAEKEDEMVAAMRQTALGLADALRGKAAEIADEAFLKTLTRDPETPLRVARFSEFHYRIVRADLGAFFVLGDCGPVRVFSDGKCRLAIGDVGGDLALTAVALPLSPSHCLIGERVAGSVTLGTQDINRMSASLSHRFFVSDVDDSDHLSELKASVNSVEPIVAEDELSSFMSRRSGVGEK